MLLDCFWCLFIWNRETCLPPHTFTEFPTLSGLAICKDGLHVYAHVTARWVPPANNAESKAFRTRTFVKGDRSGILWKCCFYMRGLVALCRIFSHHLRTHLHQIMVYSEIQYLSHTRLTHHKKNSNLLTHWNLFFSYYSSHSYSLAFPLNYIFVSKLNSFFFLYFYPCFATKQLQNKLTLHQLNIPLRLYTSGLHCVDECRNVSFIICFKSSWMINFIRRLTSVLTRLGTNTHRRIFKSGQITRN